MIRNVLKVFNKIYPVLSKPREYSNYVAENRLRGKVALITGSSYGIGYSIAERLGLEGAKVVICSRKQKNVDEALDNLKSKGIEAAGVQCHVSNSDERKRLYKEALDKFGEINILVSNVAVNPSVTGILDCDESKWDKIFDVNVKSSFMLAKETIPYIRKNSGGKIVFVSSVSGFDPIPSLGAYSVSKTALFGLTKTMAKQLGPENVQVNCVAPGLINTPFADILFKTDEYYQHIMNKTPLKRAGESNEVASVIAFLVSEDANYITGETIVVAGGAPGRL